MLSLLVGLLLGSMAVAASVNFYRVNLRQSVDARATTQQDVESALAMQAVSGLVMQAGFGIRNPSGPSASVDSDLVLLRNAQFQDGLSGQLQGTLQSLAVVQNGPPLAGNAVVWSWNPGAQVVGPVQCEGVVSLGGALLRLLPASCSNAANGWSSIAWQTQTIIASRTSMDPNSNLSIGTVFSVNPNNPACTPFSTQIGRGNTTGVVLRLTDFTNTADSVGSADRTRSFSWQVCLTNVAK